MGIISARRVRCRGAMTTVLVSSLLAVAASGCAWASAPRSSAVADGEGGGYGGMATLRRSLVLQTDTFWFATGTMAAVVPAGRQRADVMWQIYGRQATNVRFCRVLDGQPDCHVDLLRAEKLLRFVDPLFLGRDQPADDYPPRNQPPGGSSGSSRQDSATLSSVHMPATPWAGVWATDSERNLYYCSTQREPHCDRLRGDRLGDDDGHIRGWPVGVRSLLRPEPKDVLWVETEEHAIVRCTVDATHATPICQQSRLGVN